MRNKTTRCGRQSAIRNPQSAIRNRRAFTLVELLLVIGIVVILAAIMVPASMTLSQRDGVRRASDTLMGALAQAKIRALRDQQSTGVRLKLRIRNGEIPPNVIGNLTDEQGNRPPVLPITFADFNNPNNPYALSNRAQVTDVNGNGYVDPSDLFASTGLGGWADGVDGDADGFTDDIVVSDQLEFIQTPGPLTDGWVWGRRPTFPTDPPPLGPPGSRRILVPASNVPSYPPLVPVDLPGSPPLPTPVAPEPPLAGRIIYEPYANPPYSFNPLVQWTDAIGQQHPPQRNNGLVQALLSGEIQYGDVLELNGGGQLYVITKVFNPNIDYIPAQPPNLPGGLILDRPLEADVPPPMNGQANYRILRRARVLPEKPLTMPQGMNINMSGRLSNMLPTVHPTTGLWDRGLTHGVPAPSRQLNGDVVVDILFTPDGKILFGGADDAVFLWVTDTTEGNADNQRIVAVTNRTGAVGVYGVQEWQPANQNPYHLAQMGRAE